MRRRPPGSSAEPDSDEEDRDGSPQSIPISVSEVGAAAFREMQLGNLISGVTPSASRNLPARSMIHTIKDNKIPAKREINVKKESAKTERIKIEAGPVITRGRTDTPSGVGDAVSTSDGEMQFTYSRQEEHHESDMDEEADYVDSDGEDIRRLARPNHANISTSKRSNLSSQPEKYGR